jgi:gliding motility-associated-like protein
MKIFDRWGSMLFESADIRFGWDGKVNGTVAPLGNYVYVIYYMDALHKEHTVYGNVMLLR